ncbi:MAG: shikimate dehydrogenase [Candidatus Omnitrophica bacterium]|nr:shikimate dehydrogenase [Candidatus Omnitrophota bacterium]
MADFAIIIHPVNLDLLYAFDFAMKEKRLPVVKKLLEWMPPFYTCPIQGTKSITGKEAEGHFVMCPLLPEQILNHDPNFVVDKVGEAAKIAEGLGVKLLGLAAYVSLVGKRGTLIAKHVGIPVTTGTAYTIAMALEAALEAAKQVGIELRTCKVAIIGATGTIGGACSTILSAKVQDLTLVARNKQRLGDLALSLRQRGIARLETTDCTDEATEQADLIISCTNTPATLINVERLKPGAVVCDVSQPHNIDPDAAKQRNDVLVLDGGVVRPPGNVNFNFNFGLAPGLAFACIAETMILALEERYESYSLGGNISLMKIREIAALGRKHGFQLAEMRSFGREVSRGQVECVREAKLKKPRVSR